MLGGNILQLHVDVKIMRGKPPLYYRWLACLGVSCPFFSSTLYSSMRVHLLLPLLVLTQTLPLGWVAPPTPPLLKVVPRTPTPHRIVPTVPPCLGLVRMSPFHVFGPCLRLMLGLRLPSCCHFSSWSLGFVLILNKLMPSECGE